MEYADKPEIDNRNDFEALRLELIHSDTATPNGTYGSVTPILQFHIKRMFVSGTIDNEEQAFKECQRISPLVDRLSVKRFLEDHRNSDQWIKARELFLQRQYEERLADAAKLTTYIDQKYDLQFDFLKDIVAKKIRYLDDMPPSDVRPMHLKILAETLKMSYEMQRLGRNMIQGLRGEKRIEENEHFEERLKELQEIMEAKTIEVKILKPV